MAEINDFVNTLLNALNDPRVRKVVSGTASTDVKNEIITLRKELKKRDERIAGLEEQVKFLKMDVDRLEQYSRRNSLRLSGIPEAEGEDPVNKTISILNDTLKATPPIKSSEIDRIHRVGKMPTDGRPRQILIKFATYQARKRVMDTRTSLKNREPTYDLPHSLYMNEDLTKYRANLCKKAREFKRSGRLKRVWTADGNVLIRDNNERVKMIGSTEDLEKEAPRLPPHSTTPVPELRPNQPLDESPSTHGTLE